MRFLPKSDEVLADFAAHAELVRASAAALGKVRGGDDAVLQDVLRGSNDRHEAVTRILRSLRTTFLTPLDRDDLHRLAIAMDRLSTAIETAAVYATQVLARDATPSRKLSELADRALSSTCEAVSKLTDEKKHDAVRDTCLSVHDLARDGEIALRDVVVQGARGEAAAGDAAPRAIVDQSLAALLRACADAADAMLAALLDS